MPATTSAPTTPTSSSVSAIPALCWELLQPRSPLHPADTSFMYMIAGLCMLKLYQKRHPDINASAYSAYACLAVVIFFSVIGVVSAGVQRGWARCGVATCPPAGHWTLPVGLWQRQHGLLDHLLCHAHHGHIAAEHPAVLHGALEAR